MPEQLFEIARRHLDTPEFRGIEFIEVEAKRVINRVPGGALPFDRTINPYRGCTHACVYCFARSTHTYLHMDAGRDFETKIVVKVNAPDELRRELAAGTLILRDLDLLLEAREVTDVSTAFSIGTLDEDAWQRTEPGTPHPRRRLEAVAARTTPACRARSWSRPSSPVSPTGGRNSERSSRRRSTPARRRSRPSCSTFAPASVSSTCRGSRSTTRSSSRATRSCTDARTRPRPRGRNSGRVSRAWSEASAVSVHRGPSPASSRFGRGGVPRKASPAEEPTQLRLL